MAVGESSEVERGDWRHVRWDRVAAAALLFAVVGGFALLKSGWLVTGSTPAQVPRVELSIPRPPVVAATPPPPAELPPPATTPQAASETPQPPVQPPVSAQQEASPALAPTAQQEAPSQPPVTPQAAQPPPAPAPVEQAPSPAPPAERQVAVLPPPATAPQPAPAPSPPARDHAPAPPTAGAADPALVEASPHGPLPIIGRDGRQPWRVYARPFDQSDKRPRIAIIVTGLGPSGAAAEASINELPGGVTLAFDPYGRRLREWIDLARGAGHEVLLALPMEPADYPRQDPGPYTLLTSLGPQENIDRLDWVLGRVTGYVGVTTMMGARFTASPPNLVPVFDELKKRGLMFVDSHTSDQSVAGPLALSMGLPRVVNDQALDADANRDAIDRRLAGLEETARRNGAALGIGFAYPVTIERISLWLKTLEGKGIALAPVSALAAPTPERKGAAK